MQVDISEVILATCIHPSFLSGPKYSCSGLSAKVIGNCSVFEMPGQTVSSSEKDLMFKVLQSSQTACCCYSRKRFNNCLCYYVGYCNLSVTCLQLCRTEGK